MSQVSVPGMLTADSFGTEEAGVWVFLPCFQSLQREGVVHPNFSFAYVHQEHKVNPSLAHDGSEYE